MLPFLVTRNGVAARTAQATQLPPSPQCTAGEGRVGEGSTLVLGLCSSVCSGACGVRGAVLGCPQRALSKGRTGLSTRAARRRESSPWRNRLWAEARPGAHVPSRSGECLSTVTTKCSSNMRVLLWLQPPTAPHRRKGPPPAALGAPPGASLSEQSLQLEREASGCPVDARALFLPALFRHASEVASWPVPSSCLVF